MVAVKRSPVILVLASSLLGLLPAVGSELEITTGRPVDTDPANFVEGPFTLEPGRTQIEWGAVSYGRDRTVDQLTDDHSVGEVVLRTALTANLEFQLFHDGYLSSRQTDRTTGKKESIYGLGDTTVQLKQNFMGNDHGRIAFGATAFVLLHTGHQNISAGETAAGGSLMFAATLHEDETSSITAHSQVRYYHASSTRFGEFSQSFIYGKDFDEQNSLALEINAYRSTEAGAKWSLLSSITYTRGLTERLSLDIAGIAGLNAEAADYGGFAILTVAL